MDENDIEECAALVRRQWGLGLGPIPNIINRLEMNGILVLRIFDGCHEVDAFSHWSGPRPCVFLVMEKGSASRTRFDAAHELGHLVMHADVTPANPDAERQANRFAGAFLLPRESFVQEWPGWLDWEALKQLKLRWRVSYAALIRRAFDLGLLSQASYRRAYLYLSKTNQRQGEADEPPDERPSLLADAMNLVADDFPAAALAAELGVSMADLMSLLEGTGEVIAARPLTQEEAAATNPFPRQGGRPC